MRRIFNNSFLRGSFITTFFALLVGFINYIFNFLNARFLGPIGYGEISAFFSYVAILSIPISVISVYIMQKISSKESEKQTYVASLIHLFWSKIRRWMYVPILALLLIPFIPRITNLSLLSSAMLLPVVYLAFIAVIYSSSNQGMRLFLPASGALFLSTLLKLPGPFTATLGGVMIFIFLSYGANVLMQRAVLSRAIDFTHIPDNQITHRLIHILRRPEFIAVAVSAMSGILISNVDMVFVKKFMLPEDVGMYSSWTVCSRLLYYLVNPLITVGFLFFSNTKNKKEHQNTLILSIIILTAASVTYFLLLNQWGSMVVHFLFGAKFSRVIPFLYQATLYGVGYLFMQFFSTYFLSQKSKLVYVFPVGILFYVVGLWFFARSLSAVMMVNTIFSFVMVGIYMTFFLLRSSKQ